MANKTPKTGLKQAIQTVATILGEKDPGTRVEELRMAMSALLEGAENLDRKMATVITTTLGPLARKGRQVIGVLLDTQNATAFVGMIEKAQRL